MIQRRIGKLLPWLVLMIGLVATYFLQQATFSSAQQLQQENFTSQAREIKLRIQHRLETFEQVLRGVKGLYISSKKVERDEFHNYIDILHLSANYPAIQTVGFGLLVSSPEKNRHVESIRKEGFPTYALHPEGEHSFYVPVVYVEPFSGSNLRRFGYDIYSDPVRRVAMDLARDSDKAVISGKINLAVLSEQDMQPGFVMYMSVYRNGMSHETLADRRANITGWIFATFKMEELMHGILDAQDKGLDTEIFDGQNVSLETLMYDRDGVLDMRDDDKKLYHSTQIIELASHNWTFKLHSLPVFEANITTGQVTVIQIIGTPVSYTHLTLPTILLV